MSTTRTSLSNYYIPNQHTPLQQQLHQHQQPLQNRYENESSTGANYDNDLNGLKSRPTRNGANIPQSKSIESILNESTAGLFYLNLVSFTCFFDLLLEAALVALKDIVPFELRSLGEFHLAL